MRSCGTSRCGTCKRTKLGRSWEKKDKHCDPSDPADRRCGSYWDHILLDAETKLIVTLVVGRRTADTAFEAFLDFYTRTDGQLPELIATDEYAPYFSVIVSVYGVRKEELELTQAEKEALGWQQLPPLYFPVEIAYATVHKEREKGRVVRVAGDPGPSGGSLESGDNGEEDQYQLCGALERDQPAL
jgi:hypothetical protein